MLTIILLSTFLLCDVAVGSLPLTSSSAPYCDANEDYYDGNCYEFINYTSPLSYLAAQDLCKTRGKALVKVGSAGVQSFLANSAEMRAWQRALIGLRLLRDKWSWSKDGSLLYGQGCYIDNTEKRDLNISAQFLYSLKTNDCVDYCRTQPTARFAGVQGGRQCFCGSDYGTLPPTINCNTPCGGDANAVCGGTGANYIYAIDGVYSTWEDGRPANEGGCGAMVLGKRSLFPWRDVQCSTRMAHVCQFDEYRDVSDVTAYFCLYTTCYVLYDLQKTWHAARGHCQMLGGDLAKIDTTKVHSEIVAMLSDHLYLTTVWIGVSNGKWSWPDGTAVAYTSWSNYNSQPVVESPTSTCAELSSSETNYNWVTRDCDQMAGRNNIICERKSTYTTSVIARNNNNNNNNNNGSPNGGQTGDSDVQGGKSSAVVSYDRQTDSSNGAYGVVWYGWLLIGLMIGLVICVIVFILVWAFCLRRPSSRSMSAKLGSSSRPVSHTNSKSAHTCNRHQQQQPRDGASSGIGSSVNSTGSSKNVVSGNSEPRAATANQQTPDNNDITVVNMPGSGGKTRINAGRAPSETRQPVKQPEAEDVPPQTSGRRRTRINSANSAKVGPAQTGKEQHPGAPSSQDGSSSTPRDPFAIDNV